MREFAVTDPKRQRGSLFLAAGELPYPSLTLRVSMPSRFALVEITEKSPIIKSFL